MKSKCILVFVFVAGAVITQPSSTLAQNKDDYDPRKSHNIFEESQKYGFREDSYTKTTLRVDDPFNYKGFPIETHGFRIMPVITLLQSYNDNILAAEDNKTADFSTTAGVNLRLDKPIGRHYLGLQLKGTQSYYYSEKDENTTDYEIMGRANFEAFRGLSFPVELSYTSAHLARTNTRIQNITKEPVSYTDAHAQVGMVYQPNRIRLDLTGSYSQKRQENGELLNNNAIAIKEDKDHNKMDGNARISYEFGSGWEPFIEATYSESDYLRNEYNGTDFTGNSRDNTLIRTLVGTFFDFKGLLTGMVGIGREKREYKDPEVENSAGLTMQSKLTWYPLQRIKLNMNFRKRNIEDTVIAAGINEIAGATDIEYEIKQNMFARLGLGYSNQKFTGSDRKDEVIGANIGLQYIISPTLQIGADYEFSGRDSNQDGYSYNQNLIMLRVNKSF